MNLDKHSYLAYSSFYASIGLLQNERTTYDQEFTCEVNNKDLKSLFWAQS